MVPTGDLPPPPPGWRKYWAVLVTYVSCASFHASREAFVAVKGDFQRRLHFPTELLGYLDTTFLVCYGFGLLFSGSIGARYGNKTMAIVGLAGTALVIATMALLSMGWITDLPTDKSEAWTQGLLLYVPLWAVNGFIQSLGFPNLVAVTSGWVNPEKRGLVLGMWSTTGAAGDIIGLSVATHVLERSGGVGSHAQKPGETTEQWTNVFWAIAVYLAAVSLLLAFGVEDRAWIGLNKSTNGGDKAPGTDENAPLLPDTKEGAKGTKTRPPANITGVFSGLKEAWSVPGVLDWSMSYFFIKTVTYTILFWMPYYLTLTLSSQAAADNLTVLFDVAMIVGCTLLGYVTDAFGGTRSPGFFVSYIFGALPLLFLPALQRSIPHYAVAFGIIGVFTGGPAHMYGTAVSVDLGVAAAELGKPGLVSSLSGLIDGIGTLGAAVGQTLVAKVASAGESKTVKKIKKVLDDAVKGNETTVEDLVEAHSRPRLTGNITEDMASGATDYVLREWSDDEDGTLGVETSAAMAGGRKKGLAHGVNGLIRDLARGSDAEIELDREERTNAMAFGTMPSLGDESDLGRYVSEATFAPAIFEAAKVAVAEEGRREKAHEVLANVTRMVASSALVDDDFQERWSRVFLMLFIFNVLAAVCLLRVAHRELTRAGVIPK